MPDSTPPTLANFDAATVASLSAQERITFADTLVKAGYDKAQVERVFGQGIPAVSQVEQLDPMTKRPSFSDKEKVAMAEQLKKHWTGDPNQLQVALEEEGLSLVDPKDDRSDEEKEFDAGLSGAADPSDYHLSYVGRTAGIDPAEVAALDGDLKVALSAMEFPAVMGQGVVDAVLDSAEKFSSFNETQRGLFQQEQKVLLDRIGSDLGDRETILAYAAHALSRVTKDVRDDLVAQGAFESAAAVIQLARQGQRLFHRQQLAAQRKK